MNRSKRQYREFMHADTGHSFAEWLGIDSPIRQYHPSGNHHVRIVKKSEEYKYHTYDLPYFSTVKEAKADYKQRQKTIIKKNKE